MWLINWANLVPWWRYVIDINMLSISIYSRPIHPRNLDRYLYTHFHVTLSCYTVIIPLLNTLLNLSSQPTLNILSQHPLSHKKQVNIPLIPVEHDPSKPHKGGRKRKLNEDGTEPPPKMHSRGFAFVTFLCEHDAANAVTKSR